MAHLLVVDDSELERHRVQGLIRQLGEHTCDFAANGVEAIKKLESGIRYEIVLTDLYMPEMNGLKLLDHIIEEQSPVPVIVMTSRGSEETAVEALRRGAAYYVPKRTIESSLQDAFARVLSTVQSERRHQRLVQCMTSHQFKFELDNDREHIPAFVSLIQDQISSYRAFPRHEEVRISVAVQEALTNAMIHGNLSVSSATREGDKPTYEAEIERKLSQPEFGNRRVKVDCSLDPAQLEFVIRDEGEGFDPSVIPDPTLPENLLKSSGRGMLMMKHFMDEVHYNETGNQVRLVKTRDKAPTEVAPRETAAL